MVIVKTAGFEPKGFMYTPAGALRVLKAKK